MSHQTAATSHDITTLPTAEHLRVARPCTVIQRLETSLLAVLPGTIVTAAAGIATGNGALTGGALAAGSAIAIGTVAAIRTVEKMARVDAATPAGAAVVAERPDYSVVPGDITRRPEAA